MKKSIKALKYRSVKEIGAILGGLLDNYSKNILPQTDITTFVPITKKKLRDRGFNQAQVLGYEISPNTQELVFKIKDTPNQADISFEKRKANLRGIFECRENLEGKRVLIIDDVCTTGTTLTECSKVLKKSGAKKVYGVVICRGH